jgi:hypothetical protein
LQRVKVWKTIAKKVSEVRFQSTYTHGIAFAEFDCDRYFFANLGGRLIKALAVGRRIWDKLRPVSF